MTPREALQEILKRHDNGKCTCGGCCIARSALTGGRGDDTSATPGTDIHTQLETAKSEALMYKKAADAHFRDLMGAYDQRDAAERERDEARAWALREQKRANDTVKALADRDRECDELKASRDHWWNNSRVADRRIAELEAALTTSRWVLGHAPCLETLRVSREWINVILPTGSLIKAIEAGNAALAAPASPATATKRCSVCNGEDGHVFAAREECVNLDSHKEKP